jgi:cyanoexosortase B-associated protein
MTSFDKVFQKHQLTQLVAILWLVLLLGVGAVPGYLAGHWQWQEPPAVTHLKQLKHLRTTGLNLPGWQNSQHSIQEIGEHRWSVQLIQQENSKKQAILLLFPQNGPKDQPEVEWTDINGWGNSQWKNWEVSQYRAAEFSLKQSTQLNSQQQIQVKARFLRASTQQQTFAVLEWYAQPTSGDPTPLNWFVADQWAQWQKKRVPWVAVTILFPMEPLGQVEKYWSEVESIGKLVQQTLVTEVF